MSYCGDPWCEGCGIYGRIQYQIDELAEEIEKLERNAPTDFRENAVHQTKIGMRKAKRERARKKLREMLEERNARAIASI